MCSPLPKTLTLFMTKICDFPYPIYDLTKNLIPCLYPFSDLPLPPPPPPGSNPIKDSCFTYAAFHLSRSKISQFRTVKTWGRKIDITLNQHNVKSGKCCHHLFNLLGCQLGNRKRRLTCVGTIFSRAFFTCIMLSLNLPFYHF